ncbi:calcium/sodium antiporter [bacterium]|nr:calcium/sodium antiporter [bacterium]
MTFPFLALIIGLALLVWSADRFVDGSASTARYFGMSPLLIGMVIVGFGTSAPEMMVSAISAYQGNPGIAIGNAYGSNITNIALILGITALINPIHFQSKILRKELPILTLVTVLAGWQIFDNQITRLEAVILLLVFFVLMAWTVWGGLKAKTDSFGSEVEKDLDSRELPISKAVFKLITGLILLIVSSRLLVWGAVKIAHDFGVSDLIIGLTIVAIGTSLPELASSVIAARKGEHEIALGNVLGSNLFNTLAVVGIAGSIAPVSVEPEVITRDLLVMAGLTVSLFVIGYGFKGPGIVNRFEGSALLACYFGYVGYLVYGVLVQ